MGSTKKVDINYKRNHDGLYTYSRCDEIQTNVYRVRYTYRTNGEILTPNTIWTKDTLQSHKGISEVVITEI